MIREEILEYPYSGIITRITEGHGNEDDVETTLYEGVMDEHLMTDNEGRLMQTAAYILSIPLVQDENGGYIVPRKGDKVELLRYGETIFFEVDNAEPSQLGGVSIHATRKSW